MIKNDLPVITALGSCRVYDPVKKLENQGLLKINNKGVYGYTHNTKEIIQQLEVIADDVLIPWELKQYITHKILPENADSNIPNITNDFAETDLFIVEISSLREVVYDGYFLQINRVNDKLVKDRPLLQEWFVDLKRDTVKKDDSYYLQGLEGQLSDFEQKIVRGTKVITQDGEIIAKDISRIVELLGKPTLFITHFDIPDVKGNPIPLRVNLVKHVMEAANKLNQQVLNPRKVIEFYGQDRALKDMAHYSEGFTSYMGKHLYQNYIEKIPSLFSRL